VDAPQIQSKVSTAISEFRERYNTFEDAYHSYTAQYGDHSVKAYSPYKISGTIDPVIIILGRTTPLFYRDTRRVISGSVGSLKLEPGSVCILGRREPPDSKLIGWSQGGEIELEHYDTRVRVIPSRMHAAIISNDENEVYFSDLGSTSGSILAGESTTPEPFTTLYATSKVEVHRITIDTKYARTKERQS